MKIPKSLHLISIVFTLWIVSMETRPSKSGKNMLLQPAKGKTSLKSIILFPKARSWCRAQEINHIIDHEGCESVKVQNKFCIGQCFSYTSPDIMPRSSELRLAYCDSCQPTKTSWEKVQLKCKDNKTVDKLVELILECKCKDCRRNYYG